MKESYTLPQSSSSRYTDSWICKTEIINYQVNGKIIFLLRQYKLWSVHGHEYELEILGSALSKSTQQLVCDMFTGQLT